jgi:predicted secreted protein
MPGKAAFGCVVSFGTATGTATTATLTNVTNIGGLDTEVEVIDVTSHDSASAYREKVASFIDAGQLTMDVNFNPNETTHRATTGGILYLRDNRTIVPWKVTFPGTPVHSFLVQGFVKSAPFDAPFDDKLSATITVELTGSATWTYGT